MSCNHCGTKRCACKTKIITKQGSSGRNGTTGKRGKQGDPGPAGTSSITIKYTAFVSKNGNDATGLVERFDKTFLTITAATNALHAAYPGRDSENRCRVVVYDGKYTENILLKKFIDYDLGNIILNGVITDDNVDMGASETTEWTNIIWGTARIYNETGVDSLRSHAVILHKPNTKLLMYCNEIATTKRDALVIENGFMRVYCNRIYTEDISQDYHCAVEMTQGLGAADYTFSKLEIIGADIYNKAGSIASTIQFNGGAGLKNQTLTLINCRVKNTNVEITPFNDKSAVSSGPIQSSGGKLVLYNTVLYTQFGNSIFVDNASTLSVHYYHSNMSNKVTGLGGTGVLTTVLGALTVNVAVAAEF